MTRKMTVLLAIAIALLLSTAAHARTNPGNITIYVAPATTVGGDPAGSDTTGDGTATRPYATPQHAVDIIYSQYDFEGSNYPTIQLEIAPPGSNYLYPSISISGRYVGQGGTIPPLPVDVCCPPLVQGKYLPFTIQGNPARLAANRDGAFIAPSAFGEVKPGISLTDGAAVKVSGFTIDTYTPKTDCISLMPGTFMDLSAVTFGNAGIPGPADYNNHITVSGANLFISGGYTIGGSAAAHILLTGSSFVMFNTNGSPGLGMTVDITANASSFGSGFVNVGMLSTLMAQNITWNTASAITGNRAVIYGGGVVITGTDPAGSYSLNPRGGDPNYFPGNAAPLLADTAVYK